MFCTEALLIILSGGLIVLSDKKISIDKPFPDKGGGVSKSNELCYCGLNHKTLTQGEGHILGA